MTRAEADEYMIQYLKRRLTEDEEHATRLEHLYPYVADRNDAELMKMEAKHLREEIVRLRELAKKWPIG